MAARNVRTSFAQTTLVRPCSASRNRLVRIRMLGGVGRVVSNDDPYPIYCAFRSILVGLSVHFEKPLPVRDTALDPAGWLLKFPVTMISDVHEKGKYCGRLLSCKRCSPGMATRWRVFTDGLTEISNKFICKVGIGLPGWK